MMPFAAGAAAGGIPSLPIDIPPVLASLWLVLLSCYTDLNSNICKFGAHSNKCMHPDEDNNKYKTKSFLLQE